MGSRAERSIVWTWAAVALVLSLGLCFVPLFDLLGYELALAITVFAGVVSIHLGVHGVIGARRHSPAYHEAVDAHPLRALVRLAARALFHTLLVLCVPLATLSLNAFRVRSCNPGMGVAWYLVLPVPTAIVGASYGVALGTLRSRRPILIAFAVPLVALVWSLARIYFAPPIFVFDPLLGYFAGSVYDERVSVPSALLYARLWHLVLAGAALAIAAPCLDGATLTQRWRARRRPLVAIAAASLASFGYLAGPRLGYREDARTVAAALGGQRETTHFVLHYAEGGPFGKELDDVGKELELRWAELAATLGRAPQVKVHAYLFGSPAEKQALIGAGSTLIAKPWRRELYVNYDPFPQLVLGHELAHVFGADDGDWLLGLPRAGLRVDIGLTEGFAEAITWHHATLTSDESVAILERLGRLPSLDRVMSPAFWSLPEQQAYAVAGSFCHFLLERFGAEKLRALYHAGGTRPSYEAIYGETFGALASEWLTMIRAVTLTPGVLERERDRILRPSIFRRPCARELARRLELARAASGRGDHAQSIALLEWVCKDEPDDPGHVEELLAEAARAGDATLAHAVAERLFAHPKASLSQRAATWAALGDLAVVQRRWREAADDFGKAEQQPSDEALGRLYTAKRIFAARLADHTDGAKGDTAIVPLLSTLVKPSGDPTTDFLRITSASTLEPDDPLLAYLAARQLANRALWSEAEPLLARATAGVLPDERFVREARRLAAECAFRRHDYAEAERRFTALADLGPTAARLDATRWARRARFFRTGSL